ncbi:MAG: fasciclin domain-containing protein, partial [Bdellovibrionales bacterium]
MKCRINTMIVLAGLCAGITFLSGPAGAHNRSVETTLAGYGDTSLFYQALLNTGVLAELDENARYTVFAPVNASFAVIRPDFYPCFYSTQCRPQLAEILRNHIMTGNWAVDELARKGDVKTLGQDRLEVESPFVGDYAVSGRRVLSAGETDKTTVYRIDGLLADKQQLEVFRNAPAANVMPDATVPGNRTVITYQGSGSASAPGGSYTVIPEIPVKTSATTSGVTTTVYSDGTRTVTTSRPYMPVHRSSLANEAA